MDIKYIINGVEINSEKELRAFAMDYSPESGRKAFKQDFRLANGARTKPVSDLLDLLEEQGAEIQRL